jgi:hypothetical protein
LTEEIAMSLSLPLLPLLGVLLAVLGQTDPQRVAPPEGRQSSLNDPTDDRGNTSETVPTAEAMLEALRRYRPDNAAIESVGGSPGKDEAERKKLWPEGTVVVSRPGRLAHDEGWWVLTWVDETKDPPVQLLPNAELEKMVRTSEDGQLAIVLEVSGEFTVFEGSNYLLVTLATRSTVSVEESALGFSERSGGRGVADASDRSPPPSDASVEDVIHALETMKPARPALPVAASEARRSDPAGRRIAPWAPIPDGSPLSRRPGRLVRQGSWWTFVFESSSIERPELPLKLLPNLNVENMVKSVAHDGESGLVFLVSGEVTAFLGENFLLSRSALRRVDTGNLRQ